jgi:hypothetical protein
VHPWQECSIRLIEERELDPVYNLVAFGRDRIGQAWAERFCMAHLMFYNVETSLTLADSPDEHFWFRTLQGYHGWKRGQERRHYRASTGLASIDSLRGNPAGAVFRSMLAPTLAGVVKNVQISYKGFGSYFILKWADLLDVVFKAKKGLESIWPGRNHAEGLAEIVDYIKLMNDPFQTYRYCGLSEAETIACAYRTYYIKDTYKFGWDINNLHAVLNSHPTKHAKLLKSGLPKLTKEWR